MDYHTASKSSLSKYKAFNFGSGREQSTNEAHAGLGPDFPVDLAYKIELYFVISQKIDDCKVT